MTALHLKGLKKKEKKTNFKFIYLGQMNPTSHAHWHWLTTSTCLLPYSFFATLFRPTANFHMATFEYCSDCSSGQRMSLPQQTNTIWIYPSPFPFPSAPLHCEITRQAGKGCTEQTQNISWSNQSNTEESKKIHSKMEEKTERRG